MNGRELVVLVYYVVKQNLSCSDVSVDSDHSLAFTGITGVSRETFEKRST